MQPAAFKSLITERHLTIHPELHKQKPSSFWEISLVPSQRLEVVYKNKGSQKWSEISVKF